MRRRELIHACNYIHTVERGIAAMHSWEQHFGRYIGVAYIEGLFCTCTNCSFGTWVPGRYIAVGLYSGVAVKRCTH